VADSYKNLIQRADDKKQELDKFLTGIEDFDTLWDNANLQERKHF